MARMTELLMALGAAQTNISTISATFQRFGKLNAQIYAPQWRTEDDADELGKGHEFATQTYKSHVESGPITLEKHLSVEFLTYIMPLVLGHTDGTTYTPLNPVTEGEELPYLTYVEQMRPGASVVRDIAYVGCAAKSFRVSITNGPGRANAKITVELAHCGLVTEPSTVEIPAAVAETLLNAYSLTCTINGVDYITAKDFVSLEMGWDNAFLAGFYPGSGQQDGYQVQGRMEIGKRVPLFNFVARFKSGSSELTKVRDLTSGTAVVGLTSGAKGATFTWQKMGFSAAEFGETDGKVTVAVTGKPLYDNVNGILSVAVDNT